MSRLADNSIGRVVESVPRADLAIVNELGFAPLDQTGAQPVPLRGGRIRATIARYRQPLGVRAAGRFIPPVTTAVSPLGRLFHIAPVVVTNGESFL